MKFNLKIQQLRREKGLSQEKLASIIGVSRQAVAKWFNGYEEIYFNDKKVYECLFNGGIII